MNSGNLTGSEKLLRLAERLRHYKPIDQQIESDRIEEYSGQFIVPLNDTTPISGRAAVLVCLFEDEEGDLRVILTKRSSTLSSHSGEVSLPGGKVDENDADVIETALREAKEEIGLDPSLVNVVAVLEPILSKKRMMVTPVIGILGNRVHIIQLQMLQKWKIYLMLPWKCSSRMRKEEKVNKNGWDRLIYFIFSIMKWRIRSL